MEARVSVLETKVDSLEKRSDEHEEEDRRLHKYLTNMMEDLQARLAGIERTGARFEADLLHRSTGDKSTAERLVSLDLRLSNIERLSYIALGAVGAVGALATFFGWNILKALGH